MANNEDTGTAKMVDERRQQEARALLSDYRVHNILLRGKV